MAERVSKRMLKAVMLGLGLLGCASTPMRRPAAEASARTELIELEEAMFRAIRGRDEAGLKGLLAEEFQLLSPGEPAKNREGFLAAVRAFPGQVLSIESTDLEARAVEGVGVLTGRQRTRVQLENGSTATDVQAFVDLAVKREGRWRIVLAHSTPVTGD